MLRRISATQSISIQLMQAVAEHRVVLVGKGLTDPSTRPWAENIYENIHVE